MKDTSTVALYVRIPADLDARIREHVHNGSSWPRKGALQAFVIGALKQALPEPAAKAKPSKKR